MLNNPVRRRKWSFEKGRNSSSVIGAVIVTLLVCIAVIWLFRYDYRISNDIRQNAAISLIGEERVDFLRVLELHDPAGSFRITDGGFPFCLNCRRSHYQQSCPGNSKEFEIDPQVAFSAEIPVYSTEIKAGNAPEITFPASGNYARILPAPAEILHHSLPVLVDSQGNKLPGKILAGLKDTGKKTLVISLSGEGLLMVSRIISSSGSAELDRQAAIMLKAAALPGGTYSIYWPKNGGGK